MEKKSLQDISWRVPEETYRNDSALSYSILAKFEREGFSHLDTLFDRVESPSLLFGSCVDTLLTDGEKAFNDNFLVSDITSMDHWCRAYSEGDFQSVQGFLYQHQ